MTNAHRSRLTDLAARLALAALLAAPAAGCGKPPAGDTRAKVPPASPRVRSATESAPPADRSPAGAGEILLAVSAGAPPTGAPPSETTASSAETSDDEFDASVDYVARGRAAWDAGDWSQAASDLALAERGGQAGPYEVYLHGLALMRLGEYERAAERLERASWRMETFARARVNLARARIELGDWAGALAAAEEAIEIDDALSDAYNVRGRALLGLGRTEEAYEAFRKASEIDPSNPWPANNLGYALLVAGRAEAAVEPLERAVAIAPDFAVAWHNLALARERAGDLAGARTAARRAADLAPERSAYRATAVRLAALAPDDAPDAIELGAGGTDDSRLATGTDPLALATGPVPERPPSP